MTAESPVTASAMARNVAAVIAVVLVVVGVRAGLDAGADRTAQSRQLAARPSYEIWITMLAGTVALWIGMSVALWRLLARTFGQLDPRAVAAGAGAWLFVVVVVVVFLRTGSGGPVNPLWGSTVKVTATVVVALVCATPVAVGLWMSQLWLRQLAADVRLGAGSPLEVLTRVPQLLRIHAVIGATFRIATVGIVVAVVTTGALRNALLDVGQVTERTWPPSLLLVYGGFFTVVFAAVFVPAHLQEQSVARSVVEAVVPLPLDAVPDEKWMGERERMATLLHLHESLGTRLTAAFGIAAPLATSALAAFVPQLSGGA